VDHQRKKCCCQPNPRWWQISSTSNIQCAYSFIGTSLITALFSMMILSRSPQSLNYLCVSRWGVVIISLNLQDFSTWRPIYCRNNWGKLQSGTDLSPSWIRPHGSLTCFHTVFRQVSAKSIQKPMALDENIEITLGELLFCICMWKFLLSLFWSERRCLLHKVSCSTRIRIFQDNVCKNV